MRNDINENIAIKEKLRLSQTWFMPKLGNIL